MDDPLVAVVGLFCVVAVVLFVLALVIGVRRRRRREQQLQQWADGNGWQLVKQPAVDWGQHLPGRNPHGVRVMLAGRVHGRPVMVGEYEVTDTQVTTGADGNPTSTSHTHLYVVTVAILGRMQPPVSVSARGRLSRAKAGLLGPGDTASGDPQFDKAFRIRGAPGPWCTPALLAAHLAGHVPVPWTVSGQQLITWREGSLRPPEPLDPVLRLAHLLDNGA
ncbi:hypothetical protein [Paractinoplanes lichenicola]|uniref:Uncharacterized protein n=1 Tax=Paractinoplanes lichenicola TaxID=2802976 RepID=A0ABS1VWP6_9ACTN|nr:hypothetical protein [Actinoplanes lichenicola]MBL7258753.1 hypothetical protein [Actinoplanes lichenicola]